MEFFRIGIVLPPGVQSNEPKWILSALSKGTTECKLSSVGRLFCWHWRFRWLLGPADTPWRESYAKAVPVGFPPGERVPKFKLHSREAHRDMKLPLAAPLDEEEGYYTIDRVRVVR